LVLVVFLYDDGKLPGQEGRTRIYRVLVSMEMHLMYSLSIAV
jgi:hypothetical protein